MAVLTFLQQPEQARPAQRKILRMPSKSILKATKRPSVAALRPLTRAITDIFPLELFRIVIDTLRNDQHTLQACSLVCRAWLPLCREHLSRQMTIHPQNALQFLDLFSSPHTSIKNSVRHLTIHKQHSVVDHFFLVQPPTSAVVPAVAALGGLPMPFRLSNILARASSFPYLAKLTLRKGYGENADMASHLRQFHFLEELEMRSFQFTSFANLTAVISAQPNIRRLSLTDIAWATSSTSTYVTSSNDGRVLPNVRRLELFMERQGELLNWILGRPSSPSIEYVELGGITDLEDAIAVGRFLRCLGPVLKHLRLYSPSRISQVNLVHNTGLQSLKISHLHIGVNDRENNNRATSGGDEVGTILSQLCSPHITKISLQLFFSEPECFAFIDWPQVARTLSLPRYRKLEVIQLRIPGLKKWMATTITKSLPNLANSGILSVANG